MTSRGPVDPAEASVDPREFRARRVRLAEAAVGRDLAGVLIWSRGGGTYDLFGDVFYLTNHYGPFPYLPDLIPLWSGRSGSALVVRPDGSSVLCVDTPEWRHDLVSVEAVTYDRHLYACVVRELRDAGLESARVGLAGAEAMPTSAYRYILEALPSLTLVDVGDLLSAHRRLKSDAEIRLLRHAAATGVDILRAVLAAAVPGATDGDCVAAGLAAGARTPGVAQWDIAMASGPDAGHFQWPRMPQWDSARRLRPGDMIHPDSYGVVNGYIFDMVRSKVVGGEPTASQRRLIQGAADCVHAIIAEMRPGVTCGQLHAAGQRSLREAGLTQETPLGNAFPAFGHHDGLGFESPWIVGEGSDADEQIRAPAVLSIEAEVTDGVEAAGCEEMVLVLPDSVEVLTSDLPIFA